MAMFNSGTMFKKSKRISVPYRKVPKNVRQSLNIDKISENGIFKLEPGRGPCLYDRCYIFEDINYANQDEEGKEGVLELLMQFLNAMKADFKVSLSNEYRDMDQFLKDVLQEPNEKEYPEIADGISQWIQKKVSDGSPNIKQVRYLVVTCRTKGFQEAQIYFNTLETQLKRLFESWGSRLYRLSAEDRLRSLYNFFHRGQENRFRYPDVLTGDWKNKIMPTNIDSYMNFMIMDGMYVSVMFGYDFSSTVDEGKLVHSLTNVTFPSFVTLDYAPIKRKILKGKIETAHMNNEKAIADENERKRRNGQIAAAPSYQKEKAKEELEGYQNQIDENNEEGFFIGLLVVVTADGEEELAQRIEQLKGIGEESGVILDIYNHRQLKALNTALPFGGRQVDHMRSFLTSSAVVFHPFYAQDVQEAGGICYGSNRTTHRLIIGDRKKLPNPHGMIVGHTGSGKSLLIKETEISQTLLRYDDDIILLDVQDEYKDYVTAIGGEFFDFTPQSKMYLNPFEIPEEVFTATQAVKDRFVGEQATFAKSFVAATMENIIVTQEHKSIISSCTKTMYEEAFSQKRLKMQPSLMILRDKIKGELDAVKEHDDRLIIRPIYNSLKEYTDGIYDMFAHPSTVSINKRVTAFGLKNVGEDMWEVAMITIMHFLSKRMAYNQKLHKATRFVIEEAQVVCSKPSSAEAFLTAVVTLRKFGGIVTMCLQNLSRALENEDLRDMFSNCAYKCFLDQGGVDAQSLASVQELSSAEFRSLNEETPGHGIMVWNKEVILFDAYMNHCNPLYDMFSTNFHEKAEKSKLDREVPLPIKEVAYKTEIEVAESEEERKSKKNKILQMVQLSQVTIDEVMLVLSVEEEQARKLLNDLVETGQLMSSSTAGIVKYHEVSRAAG